MTGVRIPLLVRQFVSIHNFYRSTGEKRSDDRVSIWIVVKHNLSKWALEQVPDRDTLADVQVSESVHMHTLRMTQFLPRTFIEQFPWFGLDSR